MKTIHKFPLYAGNSSITYHEMPAGSKILEVMMQEEVAYMWVLVDLANAQEKLEPRQFVCYGTGYHIGDAQQGHIGSVIDGEYSWHFFEEVYHLTNKEKDGG